MQIKIPRGDNVIVSYTDRINSYMAFNCSSSEQSDGLVCNSETLLKDFYLKTTEKNRFSRFDAVYTEMKPTGFTVFFGDGETQNNKIPCSSITVSLLITGNKLPVLYFQIDTHQSDVTDSNVILCFGKNVVEILNKLPISSGEACSSTQNNSSGEYCIGEYCIKEKRFFCHFSEITDSIEIANQKVRCTLSNSTSDSILLENHQTIINDFIKRISLSVNGLENTYCEALKWASFSGWSLVTGITERGIWAGLPWFRDNWGRDTFIALSGILLVTGCFNEAKCIIKSFARHQETNSHSKNYGRIPNRYRNDDDVIFNTADGTLWFIREVWEYAQYTGDIAFLREMYPVVSLALEADRTLRTDTYGFLVHDDADTWMDARIENDTPWSPRGDRANDIQALWYTALEIGSRMAEMIATDVKNVDVATVWRNLAQKVRTNFNRLYLTDDGFITDCLNKDGKCDSKIRPNQFLCLTIPSILENTFISLGKARQVTEKNCKKLIFSYGVCSLSQDDCEFHPYHDECEYYHKDAAYHNGTIWLWNTGPVVESLCVQAAQDTAWGLTQNHIEQLLLKGHYSRRAAGTLSENLDAYKTNGYIKPSGTWSQAWSVSEFCRNAYQQYLGVIPRLLDGKIDFTPRFPSFWKKGNVDVRFSNEILHIEWCDANEITNFKVYRTVCKLEKHNYELDKQSSELGQHNSELGKVADIGIDTDIAYDSNQTIDAGIKNQLKLVVHLDFNRDDVPQVFQLDENKVVTFSGYIPGHSISSKKENRFSFSIPFNEKSEWGSMTNPKQKSILEQNFLLKRRNSTKKE